MALKGFKNEYNYGFSNADGDNITKSDPPKADANATQAPPSSPTELVGVSTFLAGSNDSFGVGDYFIDVYTSGTDYVVIPRLEELGVNVTNITFFVLTNLKGTDVMSQASYDADLKGFVIPQSALQVQQGNGISNMTAVVQGEYERENGTIGSASDVASALSVNFDDNPFTGGGDDTPIVDENASFGSLGVSGSGLIVSNNEEEFSLDMKQGDKDNLAANSVSAFSVSIYDKSDTSVVYYSNDNVRVADLPLKLEDGLSSPNGEVAILSVLFTNWDDNPQTQVSTNVFSFLSQEIQTESCLNFSFLWKDYFSALAWYGDNLTARAIYETLNTGTNELNPSGLTGATMGVTEEIITFNDFPLFSGLAPAVSVTGNVRVEYFEDGEFIGITPTPFSIDVSDCPFTEPTPQVEEKRGCTNPEATNYNPSANVDDGSCIFAEQTDPVEPTEPIDYDVEDTILDSVATADEYGNLIDDTILVIQQLQAQLDAAIESGGASDAQVTALENQLAEANAQLEALTGAEGIIANLESYILLAEAGNYNGELGAFGGSTQGITNVGALNTALQTISDNVGILATAQGQLSSANALLDSIAINLDVADNASINTAIDELQSTAALYDPTAVSLADYNAAMDEAAAAQETALAELNIELQAQITAIIDANVLATADLEAAHEAAIEALQAEWDALGLVYTQAELDAAVEDAENNITPEDGVTAADVAAAQATLQAIIDQMFTQEELDAAELAATQAAEAAAEAAAAELATITAAAEAVLQEQIDDLQGQLITDADGNIVTQGGYDGLLDQLSEAAEALTALQGEITAAAGSTPVSSTNVDIQNLINAAQSEATAAAQIINAEGGVVTQSAYESLVTAYDELNIAFDTLESLYNTLVSEGVSDAAAYEVIEEQLANAEEALGQAEANNAAYTAFIETLTGDLARLEKFLVDNYNYTPYQSSSISVQSGNMPIGLSTNEDGTPNATYLQNPYSFSGGRSGATGLTPRNQVFVNFRGYAKYVKDGFAKFQGQAPKSTFRRADGEDEQNELTKTTKTGLQILGVAVGGFVLYKLLGKK